MRSLHFLCAPTIAALLASSAPVLSAPAQTAGTPAASGTAEAAPITISFPEHHYTLTLPVSWSPLERTLLEEINQRARAAEPETHYHAAYVPSEQPASGSVYVLMQFTPGILAAQSLDQIESSIVAAMVDAFPSDVATAAADPSPFHPARLDRATLRISQRVPIIQTNPAGASDSLQIASSVGLIGAEGIIWAHAYFPADAAARYAPEIDALTISLAFTNAFSYTEPRRAAPPPSDPAPSQASSSRALLIAAIGVALLVGLIAVARQSRSARPGP